MTKIHKGKAEPAFYVSTDGKYFRPGMPAEIIGVVMQHHPFPVRPEEEPSVPSFHVKFEDGYEDYPPMEDFQGERHYAVVSKGDLEAGRVPDVE